MPVWFLGMMPLITQYHGCIHACPTMQCSTGKDSCSGSWYL